MVAKIMSFSQNNDLMVHSEKNERNYGIDLLKIISMYMVVQLHVLGCGGVLNACEKFSMNYYVAWFLESSAFCAVDLFAMITGYVMIGKKVNGLKIIPLWLTVFFYSTLITLSFYFIPALSSLHKPTIVELYKCFTPVACNQYWYFSSYFVMYFFIPFLNKLIDGCDKKCFGKLCLTIIIFFSVVPIIAFYKTDAFGLKHGYSVLWLMGCYVLGGYLKRYPLALSKAKCLLIFGGGVFFPWAIKLTTGLVANAYLNKAKDVSVFIDYTSIFMVISSIALISLFRQLSITNNYCKKVLAFLSAISFSVYLVHTNPMVFKYVLKDFFLFVSEAHWMILVMYVIAGSSLIFVGCLCIDLIRYSLFKVLNVKRIPELLERVLISNR